MIKIRPFEEADWAAVWQIIAPVFRAGETYAFSPEISEGEARNVWVRLGFVDAYVMYKHLET